MRISDWSSDVCSSDLGAGAEVHQPCAGGAAGSASGAVGSSAGGADSGARSEEHTSELQSLMRISYAVFCLKKKRAKTLQSTSTTTIIETKLTKLNIRNI